MEKSIARNTIYKLILNIFNLIIPILISPYILRILGPDMMGTINFTQSLYGYFYIFASFGVYQYGLREISRVKGNEEEVRKIFTNLFFLTFCSSMITYILYLIYINANYSDNSSSMYVIALITSFNFLGNIFYVEWVNEALEKFDFITIKTIIIRLIYIVLLLILVKVSDDFYTYVIILTLTTILNNVVSFIYIKRKIKFSFKNFSLLPHIKPLFMVVILSNVNVLYTQLDKIMLGNYVDMASVSFYTIAQSISNIINTLLMTVITVSLPRLANLLANNNIESYSNLLNRITKLYFIVLYPISILIIMLSKEIVTLYGGLEYVDATNLLVYFSVYNIFIGYELLLGTQVLYLHKKESIQIKLIFISGLINLISNFTLVILGVFTAETAILTTIVVNVLLVFMERLYISKHFNLKLNIFSWDMNQYFIYSLIFVPIIFYSKSIFFNLFTYTPLNIIIFLSGISIFSMVVYLIILFLRKDKFLLEGVNLALLKIRKR